MACPSCGTTAPSGARFCAVCGTALERRSDERRLVTVLFADLVGYTTLAESRDPESVKNQVDACFERLVADITDFGGAVDKIIGDAIVAIFGAPVAHEDDPERAVRAALRMQETMAADPELRIRVGVNTGEVVFGALRAGGDLTVMGDVVNTASRLQTLAAPGQVLVGPVTYAATSAAFHYESLGLLRAKGRDEPVPAWVAQGAVGPPGARRRAARATPLIGRDSELALLRHTFSNAVSRRRAAVVLLVGEAGAGKTRLADELIAEARAEGAYVLEGRCAPYGEVNVFAPLAEALRRAAGVLPDDGPDVTERKARSAVGAILGVPEDDPEVERLLAGISQLMGKPHVAPSVRGRPTGGADDADLLLDEVLYPVQVCLERLCSRRPLLFVIGELHWADDALLAFIDRLMERVAHQPLMLLATARPELLDYWEPPRGRHNRAVLHVDPLDAEASAALLAHLAGPAITPERRHALVERSGGNPLWLEELAALDSGDGEEAPATLRGMVAARLDRLSPEVRSVLQDAAVRGRSGTVAALRAMAEADGRPPPESALDVLADDGLLNLAHGREGWELRSEVVRDVAYATLTKAERARRHARFAAWLGERSGEDLRDDQLDDIAHHWAAAAALAKELGGVEGLPPRTVERALEWVTRAAERAIEQELWLPAAALLDTALELADDAARPALFLYRARARAAMHDADGARRDLAEVADDDPGVRARKLIVAGELARQRGDLVGAEQVLSEALALSRKVGDQRMLVEALHRLAMARIFAGDHAGAAAAAAEALDEARAAGDGQGEAWALQQMAWSSFSEGRFNEAETWLNQSAEVFSAIGDWGGYGWAVGLLAFVRLALGDLDEAERLGREVLAEAEQTGERWALGMMRTLVASTRLWSGAPEQAIPFAEGAAKALTSLGDAWGGCQALLVLGRARINAGMVTAGREALTEAMHEARRLGDTRTAAMADATMCVALALQLGDPEAALAVSLPADGVPYLAADELAAARAVAWLQLGRVEEALATVAPLLDGPPLRPCSTPWVAIVLTAAGRRADARRLLEDADPAAPSTYLDRVWLAVARALAWWPASLEDATRLVAATTDVTAQANVARAAAVLAGGPGDATPWSTMWLVVREATGDYTSLPTGR